VAASTSIKIPLTIRVNYQEIKNGIGKIVADVMNKAFTDSQKPIRAFVSVSIRDAIKSSDEYREMAAGTLQQELGVPDLQARIDRIIDYWANINIKVIPARVVGTKVVGGMRITAVRANFQDVLISRDATFITENGTVLPWLEWMLLRGSSVIIMDYEIGIGLGRTGNNVMIHAPGSHWSIPPQFAGTKDDNFVTRSLDKVRQQIADKIEEEIFKRI
jgi:hypothetical protein